MSPESIPFEKLSYLGSLSKYLYYGFTKIFTAGYAKSIKLTYILLNKTFLEYSLHGQYIFSKQFMQ
jgi:hypothetical protein